MCLYSLVNIYLYHKVVIYQKILNIKAEREMARKLAPSDSPKSSSKKEELSLKVGFRS